MGSKPASAPSNGSKNGRMCTPVNTPDSGPDKSRCKPAIPPVPSRSAYVISWTPLRMGTPRAWPVVIVAGCRRFAESRVEKQSTSSRQGSRRLRAPWLLEDEDVPFGAEILEDLRPHRDAHLAEVRLLQQRHVRPGLADAAPDRERDLVVHDRLVIRQGQEVHLAGDLELLDQRLLGDTN